MIRDRMIMRKTAGFWIPGHLACCKRFISVRAGLLFAVFGILLVIDDPPYAVASIQVTYYAAPTGGGSVCTLQAPGSLTSVRDKVRAVNGNMTGDVVIYLRGGAYALTSPFQLTESASIHDSGSNGYSIIYKAY